MSACTRCAERCCGDPHCHQVAGILDQSPEWVHGFKAVIAQRELQRHADFMETMAAAKKAQGDTP